MCLAAKKCEESKEVMKDLGQDSSSPRHVTHLTLVPTLNTGRFSNDATLRACGSQRF